MRALAAVSAVVAVLAPGISRADVLMPPPPSCPEGARGRTSHAGPHCAPWTCEQGCGEGKACKASDLCIVQRQGASRARRFTFEVVRGPCDAGRKCAEGACESREVCVAAPVEPPPAAAPDAAAVPAPATPAVVEPASAPDARVLEDKKLLTETRKPAACSSGLGGPAVAPAFPVALLALLTLRRRRQQG